MSSVLGKQCFGIFFRSCLGYPYLQNFLSDVKFVLFYSLKDCSASYDYQRNTWSASKFSVKHACDNVRCHHSGLFLTRREIKSSFYQEAESVWWVWLIHQSPTLWMKKFCVEEFFLVKLSDTGKCGLKPLVLPNTLEQVLCPFQRISKRHRIQSSRGQPQKDYLQFPWSWRPPQSWHVMVQVCWPLSGFWIAPLLDGTFLILCGKVWSSRNNSLNIFVQGGKVHVLMLEFLQRVIPVKAQLHIWTESGLSESSDPLLFMLCLQVYEDVLFFSWLLLLP